MQEASRGGFKYVDESPGSGFSLLSMPILNSHNSCKIIKGKENKNNSSPIVSTIRTYGCRTDGPKFLIVKRNEANKEITLKPVSCFTIEKKIETFAGTTKNVKRVRDG